MNDSNTSAVLPCLMRDLPNPQVRTDQNTVEKALVAWIVAAKDFTSNRMSLFDFATNSAAALNKLGAYARELERNIDMYVNEVKPKSFGFGKKERKAFYRPMETELLKRVVEPQDNFVNHLLTASATLSQLAVENELMADTVPSLICERVVGRIARMRATRMINPKLD